MTQKSGATFLRGNPYPRRPRRIVTDMPGVPALQFRDPVALLVLSKAHNRALHSTIEPPERRSAIGEQIFDDRFSLYGEDPDLCDRLASAGWRVVYTPRARIVHYEGRSLVGQAPEIQMNSIRGLREIFALRNGGRYLPIYDVVASAGIFVRMTGLALAMCVRVRAAYMAEALRMLIHLVPVTRPGSGKIAGSNDRPAV